MKGWLPDEGDVTRRSATVWDRRRFLRNTGRGIVALGGGLFFACRRDDPGESTGGTSTAEACAEGGIKSGKLLIRRNGSDDGARPIEPCTDYWSSPDIWVEGGISESQAQEGESHTIKVRVKNLSTMDTVEDVNIEAWVCDYTAGALPTGQLAPPGRMTGFLSGPLGPGAQAEISCNPTWTPTSDQVSMNGGHLCLAANAWAEVPSFDGNELPAAGTLRVCCDTHHGQRNIGLVAARAGEAATMGMKLQAPADTGSVPLVVEIHQISGEMFFGDAEMSLLRSHSEYGERDVMIARLQPQDFFLEGEGIDPTREAELEVDEEGTWVRFHVAIDPDEASNTLQLFDITTRNPDGQESIGGSRLIVLTR